MMDQRHKIQVQIIFSKFQQQFLVAKTCLFLLYFLSSQVEWGVVEGILGVEGRGINRDGIRDKVYKS